MSNVLKFSGPIKVGSLSSAPANPEVGFIYYNTSSGKFQQYNGSEFVEPADFGQLSSTSNGEGASLVGIEDTASQFTATDVEGALDEALDAAQAAQGTADTNATNHSTHVNGAASKHDASEVDVETAGNFTTAADLETNLVALDDAIQANLDSIAAGTGGSLEVQLVSTSDLTLSGEQTIDGTLTSASRVLLIGQSPTSENGIYVTAAGAWARATDLNESSEFTVGRLIVVREGTAKGDTIWANQATVATVDTNAVDIDQLVDPKLTGIEALADVTDATNVAAAGATMDSDSSLAGNSYFLDEDNMASDSNTKVASQQSVKSYVDTEIASAVTNGMTYKGSYNAATDTPSLDDGSPIAGILTGDTYTTTVAGDFFSASDPLEIGDVLIANQDSPTTVAHWTIVQANLTPATIKTQYESNSDTNAFTDSEQTTVGNQSGTNTGDEVAASTTTSGIAELATITEINTGSDTGRVITPSGLAGSTLQTTADSALQDLSEDTTPSLGGDLTLGANTIIHDGDGMKRGSSASNFLEEEYIHSATLAASTTAVISELTFASGTFEAMEIIYKLKEATTNNVRIGTIRVVTNGSSVVLNDISTETADLGISFSAAMNAANVEISHTNDTNIVTMRCDVKRIKI